jgi:hypothetical protein
MPMFAELLAILFWAIISAIAFLLGYGLGEARGYAAGQRDGFEDATGEEWPGP